MLQFGGATKKGKCAERGHNDDDDFGFDDCELNDRGDLAV